MATRSSVEEFVEKAINLHGNKYTYSTVNYINSKSKVEILCKVHGLFYQTPSDHLSGKGCAKCASENISKVLSSNTESFIEKAKAVHGDRYSYSYIDYLFNNKKVDIWCGEHGMFQQTPAHHLSGRGCRLCSYKLRADTRRSDTDSFIESAIKVHGATYNYSLVDYKGIKPKVSIICPTHGVFKQSPSEHLQNKGCPKCARYGYNTQLSGCIYILVSDNITKVGITNNSLRDRVSRVSKTSGKKFKCEMFIRFEDGRIPHIIETSILRELKSTHSSVVDKFDGSTECFLDVDYFKLLHRITKLAGETCNNLTK